MAHWTAKVIEQMEMRDAEFARTLSLRLDDSGSLRSEREDFVWDWLEHNSHGIRNWAV